ncbi:TonB-dependent receptor [Agriterribacter sp.]|uniref:TonB-dependent receptor n=1 Tax=Agriterribacter sp. TaxID=2821509 RepID=UPI002BF14D40|nr:TonB-dependent receptor [Agriterribacter sp.]HRO45552.1 TonB-dependent receptor [Agriterribacter sp.]HRQ17926.1 TonB-dependent receptor [Agriterribacter sp.]
MKLLKYLLVLLTVFPGIKANAQYIVKGYIYDLQGRQALSAATIETPDKLSHAISNDAGYFEIGVARAEGTLQVSMAGYRKQMVRYNHQDTYLNIQLEADAVSLNEVRVTAYSGNKTNKETAGAVASISGSQIRQGNGVSLQPALNSVPGVRMDQSTLSESRISIRGNGVRSPWGIRNIKIYVNDIPVTEADGTSRIEALDVNDIGKAEIIKGPASSIYGGGTGGVINFQLQRSPYQEQSFEISSLAGSYGLRRLATTYRYGGDKMNSYLSFGWQQYNGYREHSNDMRRFLAGNFQFFPSEKQTITVLLNRTTQHAQIPGSLTRQQVEDNPKQANPSNTDKQAGRYQNWTRIGIGQQYLFNSRFSNATSIFTYFYDLNHPLPYAYIRNYYESYGGRTRFSYDAGFAVLPTKFTLGAEFNQANTKGTQYVNEHGNEGAINGNTDYKNTLYSLFYQSETFISSKTTLAMGLSYNGLTYDVSDYLVAAQSGVKKFKPQASPRIALSHNFGNALSLHGSISSGFSPPSGSEIKNVDGSINTRLQAEKGINYEINAKGNLFLSRLAYDLALFKMDMKGELIGQAVQQGITIYNNSGRTSHNGIELALSYLAIKEEDGKAVTLLRPYAAVTYSHFQFDDYKILDAQSQVKATYDGNELTGIAPWVVSAGFNMETKTGIYFYGSYFFNDRLPLDDANTAYNPAYQVLNAKAGFKRSLSKHVEINIYAGLDNITNSRYSSMTALNAVAYGGGSPAYFSPSPARNGYGGLNVKYIF